MTKCTGTRAEMLAADYLRGTLPDDEARSFEEHYFSCDRCFEHLRALQAAQGVLRETPAEVHPPRRNTRRWTWAFAMAAAAILIAALAIHRSGPTGQVAKQNVAVQAPAVPASEAPVASAQRPVTAAKESDQKIEIASLADQTLPPYHATQVRGASADEHFEAGMSAYLSKDCAAAVRELKRVPKNSDNSDAAAFYAGACNYKLRNFIAAQSSLRSLANQDSPLSEAARYSLAQVALLQENSAEAQQWLRDVVALHGDYEGRAREQLRKLASLQ